MPATRPSGGGSRHLGFCWRLYRLDLQNAGFDMKALDNTGEPASPDVNDGLHINVLEFLAIIVNLWLTLHLIRRSPGDTPPGGHILSVRSDNTSAVSWMNHAARAHNPTVRNLAYVAQSVIFCSQTSDTVRIQTTHVPGVENEMADAMSRPQLHPSLGSAMSAFFPEGQCKPFQVPSRLLSSMARIVSSTGTEERFEQRMMQCLTLEPRIFPDGLENSPGHPGLFVRRRRQLR
jgi:hypothetical protein